MLREGMFIADRYEILEKIGSGGMSDVYKAKCHKLNRYVAIKVLKAEYSEDKTFVSKFRAEAQSAAGLMHSNIVNVYDVGEEEGIYYIVMELVEGITLKKYIDKKGKLGIREAVSIAIQVAQGIEAAHKHNIVHRDIKPQNIIISKEGKVKVTDFGIARAATSNTINSVVMGSVHYISPEQARGGYSDEKSDIYSFGIALFEMLTGKVPFEGDTTVSIALQHIQNDMISPKTYLPEVPVSVEKIVLKCTQKKTERRYQNMSDLIADLKRSLVTPDEDFVVIGTVLTSDAPTKMIAEEEMNEITQKMSQGLNVINPNQASYEDTDVVEEDIPDDSYDEIIEEDIADEEVEEADDSKAAKKLDKIITILGIIVAVVIVIITIVVITKVSKMLKKPDEQKKPTVTTEQVEDDKIKVPPLIGKTYEEAEKMLNDVGLGIKKVEEFSNEYEAGLIFKQSMEAGTTAPEHTQIIVTISKGPNIFKFENIVGKKQDEALKYLNKEGLKYELNYAETEDDTLVGVVAETNPVAGTEVKSGDTIVLTIYQLKGQQNAVVPDLEGKTESEARR
jgi:serine/threonine-protein kinase